MPVATLPEVPPPQQAAGSPPTIVTGNGPVEWLVGAGLCAAVVVVMMVYHDWWRHKPWSLETGNECLALAATAGTALALGVGPGLRMLQQRPGALVQRVYRLRRPVGLWAAACAAGHILMTLVVMSAKYNWAYFAGHWDLLTLGILAAAILLALASTSTAGMVRRLGLQRWKRLQSLGYVALMLVLAHYLVLGKIGTWLAWCRRMDLPMPPGTLPITLLAVAALLVKGAEMVGGRRR